MNSGELRVSNYNYDAISFLDRVRKLFERDDQLLGGAVMRAVLATVPGSPKQHLISRVDTLPKTQSPDGPESLDYGSLIFIREPLSRGALLDRLATLPEKQFRIGEHTVASSGLGFYDTYQPSRNPYSDWPCTLFDVSFGSVQLSLEPLLHPTLKSFPSTHDAVREFLGLDTFNGQSDGRLGHLQIVVPNLNARIETLSLVDNRLTIKVTGLASPDSMKLSVTYKQGIAAKTIEERLHEPEATFQLAFSPCELSVWLVSLKGFLLDFHDENRHYSLGGMPVLPKAPESPALDLALMDPIELPNPEPEIGETHRVVILTALSLEYKAVRAHLKNLRENTHPRGTVYEEGDFVANDGSVWQAYIAEIGIGNSTAAREAERAISHFNPEIIVFVGVAGGLKDVAIGDVVVATKVYGYESGKAKREFRPRPQVHDTAYDLQQRARAEAKREDWFKRVHTRAKNRFKVFVAPVASGEKVLASQRSTFSTFLRNNYGDALAIEMEGWGFLEAVHASADVRGLIVRGISDLLEGKSKADAAGSQIRAARHASAFAFEVLSKMTPRPLRASAGKTSTNLKPTHISNQAHVEPTGGSRPTFQRSTRIDHLIKDVVLGHNRSTVAPAMEIIEATDASGHNQLLDELLNYQDCEDQDTLWKALPTIEACAEFAPQLFTHAVLSRMASNPDFSVRSSAASICMTMAQFAPEQVPIDLLIKLSVHTEDWYVETPANAALKAMARSMPAVLHVFLERLHSEHPAERTHAAQAIVEIARREPEILDPDDLAKEVAKLQLKDKKPAALIARVLPKVRRAPRINQYKYGL